VETKLRHQRLRLLLKSLNKQRKLQAKKIDILCNDLIEAQRDFIKKLNIISFKAHFYEAILSATDLNGLLTCAGRLIKQLAGQVNIAFFLPKQQGFELHLFESEHPITLDKESLENCFNAEMVENICKSNKICTLEDMFTMGLQGSPKLFNSIAAVTIPLCRLGRSQGFILIYHSAENKLSKTELNNISAAAPGLSSAIWSFQVPCSTE